MALRKNILALLALVLFLVFTNTAIAACDPSSPFFCNPLGVGTIRDALILIIKFLLSIIGLISMFFIVVSGMKYITSAGNEEAIKSAKSTMTAAMTGLALAFVSYGIIKALEKILTVK
jgi:hypothetical protein